MSDTSDDNGDVPNPRTRWGMSGGLAAAVVGYAIFFATGFGGPLAILSVALVAVGLLTAAVATVADAVLLRRHGCGVSVLTTVVFVLLLGPIWVLYALWRRDAWRGAERSLGERLGRAVGRWRH